MWIRLVLVPGLTDDLDDLAMTAEFAAGLGNVERVEVLPFHQMGRYKWERLGLNYTLENVEPPTWEAANRSAVFFGSSVSRRFSTRAGCGQVLLEQSPLLALFAAIGIGYAVGRISIAGSRSTLAPSCSRAWHSEPSRQAAPPALVSSIGLVMFLYGIGIHTDGSSLPAWLVKDCCGTRWGRGRFLGFGGRPGRWRRFRRVSRSHAGHVRRCTDEHSGVAGSYRRCRRPRAGHRIFGGLPDRHHRPHPLHIHVLAAREAEAGTSTGAACNRRDLLADGRHGTTVAEVTADLPLVCTSWPSAMDGRTGCPIP